MVLFVFYTVSFIQLQFGPNIEVGKVYIGKKFKKQLRKQVIYIFEDPKDAN